MIIGTVTETFPGERRVAITPHVVASLIKTGCEVLIETGAGAPAGFADSAYADKGARIASSRAEVFGAAELICQVRGLGANPDAGRADLALLRSGQTLVALFEPLTALEAVRTMAERGVTLFALELVPRITRAQSMDVLSSMASIAGYKAVLLAASRLTKMFPMMMTAAGTVSPARVFVIGAGVAGLQAIATARRLGAVVQAYDPRSAVAEQVQSLGAKFVELALDSAGAEGQGGYAKAMDEDFYRRQRELMTPVVRACDVVICTAAVPGKKAPVLIGAEAVREMAPGSVIVDLAAERGGNCALTRAGEEVVDGGVTVLGPVNLPASVPHHASLLFAKNVATLLQLLVREGQLRLDMQDEIVRGTVVTHGGEVGHPAVRELLGAPAS